MNNAYLPQKYEKYMAIVIELYEAADKKRSFVSARQLALYIFLLMYMKANENWGDYTWIILPDIAGEASLANNSYFNSHDKKDILLC